MAFKIIFLFGYLVFYTNRLCHSEQNYTKHLAIRETLRCALSDINSTYNVGNDEQSSTWDSSPLVPRLSVTSDLSLRAQRRVANTK